MSLSSESIKLLFALLKSKPQSLPDPTSFHVKEGSSWVEAEWQFPRIGTAYLILGPAKGRDALVATWETRLNIVTTSAETQGVQKYDTVGWKPLADMYELQFTYTLPCPFCGCALDGQVDVNMYVKCHGCGAGGPTAYDKRQAVMLWNTRA